jgi:hypothetical protein
MIYSANPQVEWLLSRAYGQGGTVALPGSKSSSTLGLRGNFPPGVQDVLNRLADQYIDWPSTSPKRVDVEWCFLVGGPGNGKTEALGSLAELLDVELPRRIRGQPAPRTVPSEWPASAVPIPTVPGIEIVFINDASIPRQDALGQGVPGSLFLDLVDGMKWLLKGDTTVVLFGNINRGILVEEDAALASDHPSLVGNAEKLAQQVIRWLLDPPRKSTQGGPRDLETIIPVNSRKPYYGQFRIPLSQLSAAHDITVHVVFLDALSLLEPLPGGGVSKAIDFSTMPPMIADYRTFGGFSDDRGASREQTIAGELLARLVEAARWECGCCVDAHEETLCAAFDTCPFAQNAKWLRPLELQRRFLDVLRAAEIAAGRRLTYRDLLGHLSLAILGRPENAWLTDSHPCEWVKQKVTAINEEHSKQAVAELVTHRVYANLFPSPDMVAWKKAKAQPLSARDTLYSVAIRQMTSADEPIRNRAFEKAFNYVDPARDVAPWKNGAREKVIDAIESLEIESPSRQLLGSGLLPAEANSEIEQALDQVVPEEIATELASSSTPGIAPRGAPARRAALLRKWRNTMLLRQVGLAIGQVAFKEALAAWLAEQYSALRNDVPQELGKGIEALLLPQANAGQFLLAPFRPRTYGLQEDDLPPSTMLVAVAPGNLRIEIVPRGDTLVAEVLQSSRGAREPKVIASLVVDLSIAREAVLHASEGKGSFTEIGASAFARIERARASLVGRDRLRQASVYFTDGLGNCCQVVDNPAGPAPLRILTPEQKL